MLLISFLFTALTMPMAWSTPTGPVYKTRVRLVAIENLTWEQLPKETYKGKNGYSLRLEGLQKGINDHALARGIVVHGARYVDPDAARKTGWVGRSQGCPAVPVRIHHQLIDLIKGNNCVFIYHPSYAQHTAQYAPMFITKAYRGEQD